MCQKTTRFFALGPGGLPPMAPPGTYAYYVRQATRALWDADFGDWRGRDIQIPALPDHTKDKFDHTHWKFVDNTDPDPELKIYDEFLQPKLPTTPAEAIDAILATPVKWNIDCAHMVQIANLYAKRMILGPVKFNQLVGPNMQLRPRKSDGLKTVRHLGRIGPTDKWRNVIKYDLSKVVPAKNNPRKEAVSAFEFAEPPLEDKTEQLLKQAPAGSRVRWTNLWALLSDEFRHENCVKVENDVYAAAGIDLIFHVTRNEFNRGQLEAALAGPGESIEGNIFIDEIEVFDES